MADVSTADANIEGEKQKRPATLTILVLLLFLRVLLLGGVSILALIGILHLGNVTSAGDFLTFLYFIGLALVSFIMLVALWGLWSLKPWAWQLNMIILGFMLLASIWAHFTSSGERFIGDLAMALNIITVFYLIQGEVRDLFLKKEELLLIP